MTRAELIAALEAAPGPSRELFVAAYQIVHRPPGWWYRGDPKPFSRFTRFLKLLDAEAWLEAAVSLVPKDWWLFSLRHHHTQIRVRGDKHEPLRWVAELQRYPTGGSLTQGWHETSAAIALCAAALRAREGKDG